MVSTVLGIVLISSVVGSVLFPMFASSDGATQNKGNSESVSDEASESSEVVHWATWDNFDDKYLKPIFRRKEDVRDTSLTRLHVPEC